MFAPMDKPEDSISYSTARKRQDKAGLSYWITKVKWDSKTPKKRVEVELETIGKVSILVPPPLPKGYQMEWVDEWVDLLNKIYSPQTNSYTFDYLDAVGRDAERLENEYGIDLGYIPYSESCYASDLPPNIHADYWEWKADLEDAWGELERHIDTLAESVIKGKDQSIMPPSLISVLQEMLAKAESEISTTSDRNA